MEYPRLVYISPGRNALPEGSFDFESVKDEKDHKAALAAGFSNSVPEAIKAYKLKKEAIMIDDKQVEEKPVVKRGKK